MESSKSQSGWMYLLRTTQQHQVQLSHIADHKANILLACNSIILSLLLARIDTIRDYWCTYSMLGTSVISILLALFVVAPLSRKKRRPNSNDREFNVLYFDHFTSLPFDQFRNSMLKTMESSEGVQEAMIKDIYQIGKVLSTRKYLFLKWSSLIFMIGLLISILLLVTQVII
jgi:hypothetical protein